MADKSRHSLEKTLTSLQRVLDGKGSTFDVELVQSALAESRLSLASGDRAVAIGGDASSTTIITGDQIIQLPPEVIQLLIPHTYQPPPLPQISYIPEPGRLPPGSRLPFPRNAIFAGRKVELRTLAEYLLFPLPEETIPPAIRTIVLTGLGGVGKTQLALEFAYRYGRFFHAVHWINATLDIQTELAACGLAMGLQTGLAPFPEQVQKILQMWQTGDPRLVIFDNADDLITLTEWFPRLGNVRVLLTSRSADWPPEIEVVEIPLKQLARPESVELLTHLVPRLDSAPQGAIRNLAERLGDHPLAIDIVGRYLRDMPSLDIGQFLVELKEQQNLFEYEPFIGGINLGAIFALSYNRLGPKDIQAKTILQAACFIRPNIPIPRTFIQLAFNRHLINPGREVDRGLKRLLELGLLDISETFFSVHVLVQSFIEYQTSAETLAEHRRQIEINLLEDLNQLKGDFRNTHHFAEQLLLLRREPEWRLDAVLKATCQILHTFSTDPGLSEIDRRRAAFLLIRLKWLDFLTISPNAMLAFLEQVRKFISAPEDRIFLIEHITEFLESNQIELFGRQRARLLTHRAAEYGQLNNLERAGNDYAAAWDLIREFVQSAARIKLGAGNIASMRAERLGDAIPNAEHDRLLRQALESLEQAAALAQAYGSDPELELGILIETSYNHAELSHWPPAIRYYQSAFQALESYRPDLSPEAYAVFFGRISEAASQVHFKRGLRFFTKDKSKANKDFLVAMDLVQKEIASLENADIISDDLALAHINAGDYHWAISHCFLPGSPQEKTEHELAIQAWEKALVIAQQERLPDYIIMVEARPAELDKEVWDKMKSLPPESKNH